MSEKKTIVVGAGLLGLTTAWELASQGVAVEVIEAREGVALEASYANGAMMTASMPDPWNAPGVYKNLAASLFDSNSPMKLRLRAIPSLVGWGLKFLRHSGRRRYVYATRENYKLAAFSIAQTENLRQALDLQYDANTVGTMKVFRKKKAMAGPIGIAESLVDLGLKYELLDRDATIEEEPQLNNIRDEIAGALRFRADRSGDTHVFCRQLASRLKAVTANVRLNTPVTRLVQQRGNIVGVETDGERIAAERVILAAGVRSAGLAKTVGVSLPIAPAKGYSVTLLRNGLDDWPTVPIIDDAMHAALVPIGNALRLAGTAEFTGFDTLIRRARIDNLIALLKGVYPHIAAKVDAVRDREWAGLRPMSADGLPFIGPVGPAGLFVNTGHGHLGWTLAEGSAKLLADQILGREPAIDPAPFRPTRQRYAG